ncbi:MAG: hypothetical protein ACTHQQ_02535 [Solirubrobacteraceae bacterium]
MIAMISSWAHRFGLLFSRGRARAVLPVVGVVLACAAGGVALAAQPRVVPPNGKVGGKGYSYYLERSGKAFFHSPAACQTVTVGGLRVAVVFIGAAPACSEPAGRPVYAGGPANECSTLPGDHKGFGTTASQLKRCARAGLKAFSHVKASVDGHRVPKFARFITATEVFAFLLPKNRFPGVKQRKGRSAAYGYGLLLRGLTKGTHTVRHAATLNGKRFSLTLTLRVR